MSHGRRHGLAEGSLWRQNANHGPARLSLSGGKRLPTSLIGYEMAGLRPNCANCAKCTGRTEGFRRFWGLVLWLLLRNKICLRVLVIERPADGAL